MLSQVSKIDGLQEWIEALFLFLVLFALPSQQQLLLARLSL